MPANRSRVVVVGAGFAGFHAARKLSRLAGDAADVVLVNPTDYFLYLPLLPEVAAGILDPRRVAVSLPARLPGVRLVLGEVDGIDLERQRLTYTGPEQQSGELDYDRLVLAAGGVNKLLPIPGVAEHAHGFRGIPEAIYLRDHITRQLELADSSSDQAEREARCTFVVVGAGYTGTEVAAHGQLFSRALLRKHPRLHGQRIRWMLLDIAERVLPELDERLSRTADRVLRARGCRSGWARRWTRPPPTASGSPTGPRCRPGRWSGASGCGRTRWSRVSAWRCSRAGCRWTSTSPFRVTPDVLACGDVAAVPDLTRPGEITPMTAQHAERQGRVAGQNVAASLGVGERQAYRHHDLGFLVDLAGWQAAANPLRVPLRGVPAKAVTRGYHLLSMPGVTNRVRTASDWLLDAVLPRESVQLGLVRAESVPVDSEAPELPLRKRG